MNKRLGRAGLIVANLAAMGISVMAVRGGSGVWQYMLSLALLALGSWAWIALGGE